MDISETLMPASDQLDSIELVGSPRTFQIEGVSKGSAEQPVQIHLKDFPRPWRPGKSMRRVLAACWGTDASAYVGRSVRLYCDESVMFGKERVGGTRIEAMSHIDKPKSIPLLVSRGKSATFTVQPLPDSPAPAPTPEPTLAEINATTDVADLRAMWGRATTDKTKALITARKDELTATAETARAAVQDALAGTEAE